MQLPCGSQTYSEVDRAWFIKSTKGRLSTRSRPGEAEKLLKTCCAAGTAPRGMSWSWTFSFTSKRVWQPKKGSENQNPSAKRHRSVLPGLHGAHAPKTAEMTKALSKPDQPVAWGSDERAEEMRKERFVISMEHGEVLLLSEPPAIRSCLGSTCSQLLLIQKLISCRRFTAVRNKDFALKRQERALHGKGWLCRAKMN